MYTLDELVPKIQDWAEKRDLIFESNIPKQQLKLIEELGETAKAILTGNEKEIKDGIGDTFVVLVILFAQAKKEIHFEFSPSEGDSFQRIERTINCSRHLYFEAFDFLNDLAISNNFDLTECANLAWNEIKNRQGNTINGTFIKN